MSAGFQFPIPKEQCRDLVNRVAAYMFGLVLLTFISVYLRLFTKASGHFPTDHCYLADCCRRNADSLLGNPA